MGMINEYEAIAKSSNVYMYNVVLNIAGETYVENQALNIEAKYFDILRRNLQQYGLGSDP
jgi:penicillin-binding protein A